MNLTRVGLTIGLACVAASLLLRSRRGAASDGDDGLEPFPSVDSRTTARARALTTAAPVAVGAGAPGSGVDSPNDAERLQASGVAAPSEDESWTGDLFKSTSQESPYARAPGLPDFARGA
jgi:hypothetical protein